MVIDERRREAVASIEGARRTVLRAAGLRDREPRTARRLGRALREFARFFTTATGRPPVVSRPTPAQSRLETADPTALVLRDLVEHVGQNIIEPILRSEEASQELENEAREKELAHADKELDRQHVRQLWTIVPYRILMVVIALMAIYLMLGTTRITEGLALLLAAATGMSRSPDKRREDKSE